PRPEHAPAPAARPPQERSRDERGYGRRRDEDGDTPVGLGEHVPAFMLRPAVIKKQD
ncbi:DEAD/DEAH box helicase, partial [Methylobacterium sp. WL6]